MKLAKLLFKPKWQDKDAATRRAAVVTGNDADLVAALPEIARRDEDAGVRMAALQRLNDYEAWRERSTGDAEPAVRAASREAYLAMLCSGMGNAPPVARRIAELETLAEAEIESVATSASDTALRREALARVAKQTLIAQRVVADSDSALRLELLERVTDTTLLDRIAERTRKSDKAVSRRARELLQAAGIAAGDANAITGKARRLCERAESLMRAPHAGAAIELDDLQRGWNALGTLPPELTARFRGAHALACQALDAVRNPALPEPTPAPAAEANVQEQSLQPPAPAPDYAAAQARAREERTRHKTQRLELEQALTALSTALDAGDSIAANLAHAQVEQAVAKLGDISSELRDKADVTLSRHAELKRWQHWSNNQRRRTLCSDIEALTDSAMHPDAVATRVREARAEWQRLDAAEGTATGAQAKGGLSRRFHAACQRALKPTRVYFAKREELRTSHAQQIEALLTRASSITDDSTQWKTIAELLKQSSDALRALDSVEPGQRNEFAKRLKDAIARLRALSAAHEGEVESAKQRLIEQAAALANDADGAAAAREVRDLQKRWTALGNGRRAKDQRQWRDFRGACDRVFGKLDAQRKERHAAAATTHMQAQQVLEELAVLSASDVDAEVMRKQLRELDARWTAIAANDRALSQRQRDLHDRIALALKKADRRRRLVRFSAALEKYAFVRSAECGVPNATAWEILPSAGEFDAALQARHDRAATSVGLTEDNAARELLVRLEFLAGIDSPEEDRTLRMNFQVQRLSSRMRDRTASTPERDLGELLQAWFAQAPQAHALEQRFVVAAQAVIDSLP